MFAVIERSPGEYYRSHEPGKYVSIEVEWVKDLQLAQMFKVKVVWKEGKDWHDEKVRLDTEPPLPELLAEWDKCRLRAINLELK